MKGELEIRVTPKSLPLTAAAVQALRRLDQYDAVLFTSNNAKTFFTQALKRRRLAPPRRIIHVGPRTHLLRYEFKGQRLLFPRSALAPSDILRELRRHGATVRVLLLYTVMPVPLTGAQKKQLLQGSTRQLYFKSPSGVRGLLGQFRDRDRQIIRTVPARCIGETTAKAAREAGFKKVFIR